MIGQAHNDRIPGEEQAPTPAENKRAPRREATSCEAILSRRRCLMQNQATPVRKEKRSYV